MHSHSWWTFSETIKTNDMDIIAMIIMAIVALVSFGSMVYFDRREGKDKDKDK